MQGVLPKAPVGEDLRVAKTWRHVPFPYSWAWRLTLSWTVCRFCWWWFDLLLKERKRASLQMRMVAVGPLDSHLVGSNGGCVAVSLVYSLCGPVKKCDVDFGLYSRQMQLRRDIKELFAIPSRRHIRISVYKHLGHHLQHLAGLEETVIPANFSRVISRCRTCPPEISAGTLRACNHVL